MKCAAGTIEERKAQVLVVDDQVSVREMVALVLDREGAFAVAAEASSGLEGLQMFRRHSPEMVIAGLALPEMSGPEMIRAMRSERPGARVLVYSGTRNRELIRAGLECGAHGFVHKTESLETLRQGFCAVARGFSFFGPLATQAMDEVRATSGHGGSRKAGEDLPPKLRTVLQLVAEGLSTKQVAGRLFIAPKTAENYRMQLMQKLGLHDIASLTRYAVRQGLVE
ncbi:MAG: response regulator transcription factor [Terrimicrobiaceae bacterium]|nr:response regulator transcription factor [Terrimicrobiaceae bacterium]